MANGKVVPIKMFSDFKAWTDGFNLVQDLPGRTSGNGAVTHCDFIATCESYQSGVPQWAIDAYNSLEDSENPGLIFRVPGQRHAYGHEGPDNPIAMLNGGRILKNGFPERFLKYMRENGEVYNQRAPGKWRIKSDFSRFGAITCHAQWCSVKEQPGTFSKLWWCIGTLVSAFKGQKNRSNHCLQFHLNQAARKRWWLSDVCIAIWEARMRSVYKVWPGWGGMREFYFRGSVYYNGVDHPMNKYMFNRWK